MKSSDKKLTKRHLETQRQTERNKDKLSNNTIRQTEKYFENQPYKFTLEKQENK